MSPNIDLSPPQPPGQSWLYASLLATLTASSLVTLSLLFFTFTCRGLAQEGEWACPVATGLLCLLSILSLFAVSTSDPGVLHRGSLEQDPEARYMARVSGRLYQMPWCPTCKFHRLPRTLHCDTCKICVEGFDHHSRWLNNCVGHRNIRLYLLLLGSLTLYLGTVLATCLLSIIRRRQMAPLDRAMTILVAVPSGALLLPLILQLVTKAVAVSTARRPYEVQDHNPFDQGWTRNCFIEMCAPRGPKYMSEAVCLQVEQEAMWEPTEVTSPAQPHRDLPGPRSPTQGPPRSGQSAPLQEDFSSDDSKLDTASGIVMEGYLFKRASNAFKTWNRRWFSIQNNQLVYQKKSKNNPKVVVEDLRLCIVKHCEDKKRRFCFKVVSPTKSCMLQADSEKMRQAWIKAVETSIETAFRETGDESELDKKSSPSRGSLDFGNESKEKLLKGESALERVQRVPGNASCCDCGLADPEWASINLGITLCIECSGIHRSLGVDISKVRSLTLDTWKPELLKLMCELGNDVINRFYEANVEKMGINKPQPGQSRQEKEAYIRAKYVERKFVDKYSISPSPPEQEKKIVSKGCEEKRLSISKPGPGDQVRASTQSSVKSNGSGIQQSSEDERQSLPSMVSASSLYEPEGERQDSSVFLDSKHLNPGLQLYRASYEKNIPKMVEALAHGADVNWANSEENKATPLIQAVLGGSSVACEFLLQNGANVNQRDVQGRGPLHHATVLGHTGQVHLLLKQGANQHATDEEGKDPLSIAVGAASANIVTL